MSNWVEEFLFPTLPTRALFVVYLGNLDFKGLYRKGTNDYKMLSKVHWENFVSDQDEKRKLFLVLIAA